MPIWKRLTLTDPLARKVDVNLEAVAYMRRDASSTDDYTTIVFTAAQADRLVVLNVKETPEVIHALPPLPAA
jgi:hypothetical protein